MARGAESAGVPIAGVVGVRFALEAGQGRTAVPVRWALMGTILAVALVVASLTFASSLQTLVSHPALYGWDWSYALDPTNAVPPGALRLLGQDGEVAAWSGYDYNNVEVDGQSVPALLARSLRTPVSPPILSGHGLGSDDQIVIGAATLAMLHLHIGDRVRLSYGSSTDAPFYIPPTRLLIVGTATFPAIGYESLVADHTSMGTGVLFSEAILPQRFQRAVTSKDPNLNGPELVFVRMRTGITEGAGRTDMQRIAEAADKVFNSDPPCSRQQRRRPRRTASSPDSQLPQHRLDAGHPRRGAWCRGDNRPRAHPRGLGETTQARPGIAQGPRLHPGSALGSTRLAGDTDCDNRCNSGHPPRRDPRARAVEVVRPQPQCGARRDCARPVGLARWRRRPPVCQLCRRASRS